MSARTAVTSLLRIDLMRRTIGAGGNERRLRDEDHQYRACSHTYSDSIFASTRPLLSPNLSMTMPK